MWRCRKTGGINGLPTTHYGQIECFQDYTSGTTGRPKGVEKLQSDFEPIGFYRRRGYNETSVMLCAGPAYHAAPLINDIKPVLYAGATLVFLDKWDSETTLRAIEQRGITHMSLVPIMFQRLLMLPDVVKQRYDISSLELVIHGGAPCPIEVKHRIIDWFGPVLLEYYGASESGAGFVILTPEWLKKPGSVGKRPPELGSEILGEDGKECPLGVAGAIYQQLPPGGGFIYHKDPDKTAASRVGDYFTLGDVGYFDEDDYLFLTGRSAETIISGGVNIYPQEIGNVLLTHPAVADSATVGVLHEEWGEQVKAIVLLRPEFAPSDALAQELLGFARDRLASFKAPRSLDFVAELPRTPSGKVQRHRVRAPFWVGRTRQI